MINQTGSLSHLLIQRICNRLRERASMLHSANNILEGLQRVETKPSPHPQPFVGEGDNKDICGDPEVRFECAQSDFSCTATNTAGVFECGTGEEFSCQTGVNYGDCNDSFNGPFECNGDFDCDTGRTGVVAYDCEEFSCTASSESPYNCNEVIDFMCSDEYLCQGKFVCSNGHVFGCSDDHGCHDSFNCAATGSKNCDVNYPYSRVDSPRDVTPGDFECGMAYYDGNNQKQNDADVFSCLDIFSCNAKDEFDCLAETAFDCGTNGANDHFTCGADSRFECDDFSKFECTGAGDQTYGCEVGKFDCLGDYARPGS